MMRVMDAERKRLLESDERKKHWKKWGPYVAERQWGSVREDQSGDGEIWSGFPFEQAEYRAYRWGEDGIAGICDSHQSLCFSLAFWNEKDAILKERLFGLESDKGNHAEDVKEYYYYLDNTPTHSYMKMLYKYPQNAFPYDDLIAENGRRSQADPEYELIDTGIFNEKKYFDIQIEYAKEDVYDIGVKITVKNCGPEAAPLHLLPMLYARNKWAIGHGLRPQMRLLDGDVIHAEFSQDKQYFLYAAGKKETLFTDNETNHKKWRGAPNESAFTKDGFSEYIVHGDRNAINPAKMGTKASYHYRLDIAAGQEEIIYLRLVRDTDLLNDPIKGIEKLFIKREKEADAFYAGLTGKNVPEAIADVQRQAISGVLWNKQFYHYIVEEWLKDMPETNRRNETWFHLYSEDIMSVPDKWEFPNFFSWDTAFHMIIFGRVDSDFAKRQLILLLREWYMHPNGQLPAYEWDLSDVNPPVHAWATWRLYKIDEKCKGKPDLKFLESVFQKLLINFTWWVNREDEKGHNIFTGGFLGLDNISVFNRSGDLPPGSTLYQSDATSWMGMYCLNMLTISLELSQDNPAYEDMASKFYEHFIHISKAVNLGEQDGQLSLWNEEDGFYYDFLLTEDGTKYPLKVKSLVGLMPLLSVTTVEESTIEALPNFKKRMDWFIENRPEICGKIASMRRPGQKGRRLLALLTPKRLQKLLQVMLDEEEFLSPYGIRSLSKFHKDNPFIIDIEGKTFRVDYEPAESTNRLYGGNSNWR
ncbi:MAG: glucosidase, partial [Simkaniaceae bacterium]|nr:glucosidase [Simkaniaceae bacterium]